MSDKNFDLEIDLVDEEDDLREDELAKVLAEESLHNQDNSEVKDIAEAEEAEDAEDPEDVDDEEAAKADEDMSVVADTVEDSEESEDTADSEIFEEDPLDKLKSIMAEANEVTNKKKAKDAYNEGSLSDFLDLDSSKYEIEQGFVAFKEINYPMEKHVSRKNTSGGMLKSIKESGILTPIHVMITKEYGEWLKDHEKGVEFKGAKYTLIDGYRRVFNGLKAGLTGCQARIWNFKDKDFGDSIVLVLSSILNRSQPYDPVELWNVMRALKKEAPLSNKNLEWLLQLKPGEAAKIEAVMTCDYPDIVDSYITGKKTLQQAYNNLNKEWNAEDKGERDDKIGITDVTSDADMRLTTIQGMDTSKGMTDTQAKMEMGAMNSIPGEGVDNEGILGDSGDGVESAENSQSIPEDDLEGYAKSLGEPVPNQQTAGNRERLDPDLRKEVFRRDEYKCVCCGAGDKLPLTFVMDFLQAHHVIQASHKGPDSKDNLITLCPTCHTLIHTMLWNGKRLSTSEFLNLPEAEQHRMRKVQEYADKAYEGAIANGFTAKDIEISNRSHRTFKMPGIDAKENRSELKKAGVDLKEEEEMYRPKDVENHAEDKEIDDMPVADDVETVSKDTIETSSENDVVEDVESSSEFSTDEEDIQD